MVGAGEAGAAIEVLEKAVELWPLEDIEGRMEVRQLLVHACAKAMDPERGLVHVELAIADAPCDPWLRYSKGVALLTVGRCDESIEAFDRALDLDPRHYKALQWRGEAAALIGRHEEAVADFDRLLMLLAEADPGRIPEGREGVVRWTLLRRAGSLDALGRFAEARADRELAGDVR